MIIVVGAGPAGLSTAYHLRQPCLVIEREAAVGGLCRSFDVAGCTFDLGGHAFFTRNPEVRKLVWDLNDADVHVQPRDAWVYTSGVYVPYPFQANLYGLPPQLVSECLIGLVTASGVRGRGKPSLDEWLLAKFGRGIYEEFMRPYNEKVWAFPLNEIFPAWTGERIVQPNLREIIEGALMPRSYRGFPNADVAYPAHGGFERFYTPLAERLSMPIVHDEVVEIDLRRRAVTTKSGQRHHYDRLVSTMPMTELVARTTSPSAACRAAAAELRSNSLRLVSLVVDRPHATDKQRVYVADPDVPFHKAVINTNSSATLRSLPFTGIQAEVSYSDWKRAVEPDRLQQAVEAALRKMALIEPADEVVAADVRDIAYAYPIYTRTWRSATRAISSYYLRHGVYTIGRFGSWQYINSDAAVLQGMQLAADIDAIA